MIPYDVFVVVHVADWNYNWTELLPTVFVYIGQRPIPEWIHSPADKRSNVTAQFTYMWPIFKCKNFTS